MRWRDKYATCTRPRRPKARRLTAEEQQRRLAKFWADVETSPVLAALGCHVSAARGRFYVDRTGDDEQDVLERWGRITPLEAGRQYLLERERRQNQWYEIAQGAPKKLIDVIAGDTRGTFHGLGSIDTALRKADGDEAKLSVRAEPPGADDPDGSCPSFFYCGDDRRCMAQQALHLYFGIPLRDLRLCRSRLPSGIGKPLIVEYSPDLPRVLVQFYSSSMGDDPIIASVCTCGTMTSRRSRQLNIRPNASHRQLQSRSARSRSASGTYSVGRLYHPAQRQPPATTVPLGKRDLQWSPIPSGPTRIRTADRVAER